MFLSIASVTINQEYLIAITTNKEKDAFGNSTYSLVAILDGTKEEKTVPLVKGLDSYGLAEYIGEQIASIIESDCDSQITKDELEEYISEYKKMKEEFNACESEEDLEEETPETSPSIKSEKPSLLEIFVLEEPYSIVDKEQISTRITPIFPNSPFGNTEYQLEWAVDGFYYEPLFAYKNREFAETALTNFHNDLFSGQTRFDTQYFESFAERRQSLFR